MVEYDTLISMLQSVQHGRVYGMVECDTVIYMEQNVSCGRVCYCDLYETKCTV